MIHLFQSPLQASGNKLWGHHLEVPEAITEAFLATGSKRIVCTLNEQETFQGALTPIGNGRYVVKVNKKLQKQLGIKAGDVLQAVLLPDNSTYGLPMPLELEEVLVQEPEGKTHFEALTPGKQRTLLYIVGQGRHETERIERALVLVQHLLAQGGKIDYRQLHEDLRQTRE